MRFPALNCSAICLGVRCKALAMLSCAIQLYLGFWKGNIPGPGIIAGTCMVLVNGNGTGITHMVIRPSAKKRIAAMAMAAHHPQRGLRRRGVIFSPCEDIVSWYS